MDFLHGATNLQSVRNNNKFEEDNLHQETQNNGDIMSVPSTIYPMSIDFDIVAVRKENRLLREQVSQLQLYRSNETTFLQGEVRRLNAYIDKLNRLHDPDTQTLSRSSDKDELEKDIEIAGLKTQLDQAQKMSRLLLEVDVNSTMGYLPHAPKEMNQIKSSIHHTANILQQHISLDDQQLEQISESEELDRLVCENIGDKNILGEATTQALRALIFAFVRHRVFESKETFYDLHFDGFMTREYQKTLAACSMSIDYPNTSGIEDLADHRNFL